MVNLPTERGRKSYREEARLGFGHEAERHGKERHCRQRLKLAPSSPQHRQLWAGGLLVRPTWNSSIQGLIPTASWVLLFWKLLVP